ncbi:putative cutinase [Calycina marina]|uniref:cutinase n=1 Tax=Calycina marina TaxID=1763456 RepID=A0A9P7Z0V7_9HELO|nr:putative cutinase [Calycina marina]
MQLSVLLSLLPLAAAFPLHLPQAIRALLPRDLSSSQQDDLIDGTECKAITVIFARGTDSPGNMGESTGPPFVEAIGALVGTDNIAVQGVEYGATILTFLEGGDKKGAALMASLTEQAMTQCPSTKVVMAGYSQGGQLVHIAAASLSATVSAEVSSVVIFGDPDDGDAVGSIPSSKVLIICHKLDFICDGSFIVDSEHLNYAEDAGDAAAFVVAAAGL